MASQKLSPLPPGLVIRSNSIQNPVDQNPHDLIPVPSDSIQNPVDQNPHDLIPVPHDLLKFENFVPVLPGVAKRRLRTMNATVLKLLMFNIIAARILVAASYPNDNAIKDQAKAIRNSFIKGWIHCHGWITKSKMLDYILKTIHEFLEQKVFEFKLQNSPDTYIIIPVSLPSDCHKKKLINNMYSQINQAYARFLILAKEGEYISEEQFTKLKRGVK
jgi:hypothetical protein